ncbi:TrkH family potassium uptake protein [Lewinella sp. W8]|uniref:TrkH family potassium uptake protein n=1 Tax=Lewinella sp. W8 TaxID=2528208 RepID=UPI00106755C9|nr:potassium transporter TrkG [Lewinella sp. W8]MTB53762.1 potassium transporter TrkH [Lewinella sp. W8]
MAKWSLLRRWRILYERFQQRNSPQVNLVFGFGLYALIGTLLLLLPIFHKSSVSLLDHLFIAISAVSTTGLVTVSVFDTYNFVGQFIMMALFQLGGIGYMTLTTYFLLFTTQRITRWHSRLIGTEFTLPESIKINDFIRSVILFTVVMEILGTFGFFWVFRDAGMAFGERLWFSLFHSVSAFCTAGFSLFNDGFAGFRDDGGANAVISVLAIAGSLGFIVITDLWYRLSGKSKELTFTTKIVVVGFILLLSLGTMVFYATDPLFASGEGSWMAAFFQAMTTVGFNTVDTGALALPALLLVTFLMYVGASPSGTAGGMKITTLTAMVAVLKSRLLGQKKITFLWRTIPFERLYVATSTFMLYTSMIFLFTFLLSYTETFAFEEILFEVASALGTVGLSTGITGDLSSWGKVLISILMFIGRVGVLTFGFAILERTQRKEEEEFQDCDLAV